MGFTGKTAKIQEIQAQKKKKKTLSIMQSHSHPTASGRRSRRKRPAEVREQLPVPRIRCEKS